MEGLEVEAGLGLLLIGGSGEMLVPQRREVVQPEG